MKKPLIIFGAGNIAQLAHYYFSEDSDYEVVAFTVDEAYLESNKFCGLSIVPFEGVVSQYPPETYEIFIALSYSKLNQIRKQKYEAAKKMGYRCASYVSSHATVLNEKKIGENCFVLEDNTIQPFVKIGDNVTLWSGNHIGHHTTIHDHCFIASQVVISGGVNIGRCCFIGVNATLRDHIEIGEKCVIGAGALILADTKDNEVYLGNKSQPHKLPSYKLKSI